MNYRILRDKHGPWAVLFDRSPFKHGDLDSEEQAMIASVLRQHSLERDSSIEDAIGRDSIRVRVLRRAE